MRIGIDARMLGAYHAGIGRYIEQLVLHLQTLDSTNEYVLFLKKDNWDSITLTNPRFSKVLADIHWYGWEEQMKFSSIIDQAQVDFMHFPHWNVPLTYNGKYVLTLHDLIMYHYPRKEASTLGPLAYWVKDKVMRRIVSRAAKRAEHIFVTSEFTKHDIHETLGTPLNKMTVTYQAPLVLEREKSKAVLDKFSITKPYVLYVGSAYPHKNLHGLIKAWEYFTEQNEDTYQLVLAGKDHVFYTRLKETIPENLRTTIVFTDFIDDAELASLYKQASLFVFPSLYEGFGLPPLEAMSVGVPVVSSNRACMPEVLGEAALYADPENPEEFAHAMHTALNDEDVRYTLKENARVELQKYSWKRLAEQTLGVYKKIAN